MYDPSEAKKSYLKLFEENGVTAAFRSFVVVSVWVLINKFMFEVASTTSTMIAGFIFFSFFYTFKSKLVRFLRGLLRGQEYREKRD